ncbi:tellurite resistance TerB family protein [Martelella endophytica]|uniref:Protein YebE n=1 Tax=Martelella endophytica TaxID=1486262 RepID=A0A0D5LUI4_MAREN|nr:tellurite resistance TerB family protein [Martelella endophytica]AJY47884.1 hypothetical protein TM49_03100 [Martelella endophytica]
MDINRLLEGFLGTNGASSQGEVQQQRSGLPGGLAGGAAAGGAIALLLGTKTGRKLGGKALKYGGMAAVGGLAYKAYRDWQQNSRSTSEPQPLPKPPADSGFDVEHDQDQSGSDFRLALMRAMISAANADDHIDKAEHARIRRHIDETGLGADEKALLFDYIASPSDARAIAALARNSEQKAELYLASALAIDPDTPEEKLYLDRLADNLDMPGGLRSYLDQEAEAGRSA